VRDRVIHWQGGSSKKGKGEQQTYQSTTRSKTRKEPVVPEYEREGQTGKFGISYQTIRLTKFPTKGRNKVEKKN